MLVTNAARSLPDYPAITLKRYAAQHTGQSRSQSDQKRNSEQQILVVSFWPIE